jgi:hypothetical protein
MHHDYRIVLFVLIAGTAATFGVFSAPTLTTTNTRNPTGVSEQEFNRTLSQEFSYCQLNKTDVNCGCFARKSGTILTEKQPRVRNARYMDQTALARSQATHSC